MRPALASLCDLGQPANARPRRRAALALTRYSAERALLEERLAGASGSAVRFLPASFV